MISPYINRSVSRGPILGSDEAAWPSALAMGIVTAAIGLIVMLWPEQTLTVLAVLLGVQLVIFGLFRLIGAFAGRSSEPVLLGLAGALWMVIGIVVLRRPFESISVLVTLLGVVWLVGGSMELIEALIDHSMAHRWLTMLTAAATIVAGIVVVAWPAPTVTVIAWISGLYLLVLGLLVCVGALSMRRSQDLARA